MRWKKGKLPVKLTLTFLLSVYVVWLSLMIPETNAYLKDNVQGTAINPIGELKVVINDEGVPITPAFPENTEQLRNVTVENHGEEEMFVRVLIHPLLTSSVGVQKEINASVLLVGLTLNPDWQLGEDGYYYYVKRLGAEGGGAANVTLLEKLQGTAEMKKDDTLQLLMKVEGITVHENSYREAWWQGVIPPASTPQLAHIDTLLTGLKEN